MSDYGVDDPAWEALPWSWAADRLVANKNYWLVSASADGRPHALPVWGAWDDDEHRFVFSCSPKARKAKNLRANPRCVLTVDDTVECISVEGVARDLDDDERRRVWAERYLTKYRPHSSELQLDYILSNLMIEVVPERAFGIIEDEALFATRATRWVFTT